MKDPRQLYAGYDFQLVFKLIDSHLIAKTLQALLLERKVIVVSENPTYCVCIFSTLLYPFTWPFINIPLLDEKMTGFLDAPMPYIIGVSPETYQSISHTLVDDQFVINLDSGEIEMGDEDLLVEMKSIESALQRENDREDIMSHADEVGF